MVFSELNETGFQISLRPYSNAHVPTAIYQEGGLSPRCPLSKGYQELAYTDHLLLKQMPLLKMRMGLETWLSS